LPQHWNAFAHKRGDEVGLEHVPAAAVALKKERVTGFIGISQAKVAQKAFVIVVLGVLECRFWDRVTIRGLLVGVA
jgi:hypothetical protein